MSSLNAIKYDSYNCRFENIPTVFMDKLKLAYPAINIPAEITKMEVWLMSNPRKRYSNYYRFMVNWLNRHNRPVIINYNSQDKNNNILSYSDDDFKRDVELFLKGYEPRCVPRKEIEKYVKKHHASA